MLAPLLALLAQTAAPPPTAMSAPPTPPTDIIVIGRRAEQDLAACLASHCPPAKDIEASLQASVEQFAAGRYDDARHTLQKSIGRNRDHAAALPGPVSSLYATLATVAEHSGDTTLWLLSARSDVAVLRRHLGEANPATLREELAFADSLVGLDQPSSAASRYRKVQRMATARGQTDLASGAAFRRAWLAALTGDDRDARRGADEAVALAGAGSPAARQMRDIIQARIAIRRGDDGAIDRLAARLRQSPTDIPQLMFAPAVSDINPARTGVQQNPWNDAGIRFADIGYWIRPDGRTAGVELLRTAGLGAWTPGILKQVGQRRYVPLDVDPGAPGLYRIDRFTVRGTLGIPTGSHIVQRMGDLSVHVVDLTATDAMSDAQRARLQATTSRPPGSTGSSRAGRPRRACAERCRSAGADGRDSTGRPRVRDCGRRPRLPCSVRRRPKPNGPCMRRIATFAEFWPHYLREHSRPATRAWHYAGTTLSILCLVAGVITGRGQLFLLVPLSGYLFAWMAHAFIERNRPATFQYPLWSLAADFVMYGCWISGQMPRQLARAGVR